MLTDNNYNNINNFNWVACRYSYSFPFLDTKGIVAVDDDRVGPLYEHTFPPSLAPSLSFVGIPRKVNIFNSHYYCLIHILRYFKDCQPNSSLILVRVYFTVKFSLKLMGKFFVKKPSQLQPHVRYWPNLKNSSKKSLDNHVLFLVFLY